MNQSQAIMESLDEKTTSFERVLKNEIEAFLTDNPDASDSDVRKHIDKVGKPISGRPGIVAIRGQADTITPEMLNTVLNRVRSTLKKRSKVPALTTKSVLKTLRGR